MFHAPMGRFQLEFIVLPLFSTIVPSNICMFLSCRPFVVITTFLTCLVGVDVTFVSWLGRKAYRTEIYILDGTTVENKGKTINTISLPIQKPLALFICSIKTTRVLFFPVPTLSVVIPFHFLTFYLLFFSSLPNFRLQILLLFQMFLYYIFPLFKLRLLFLFPFTILHVQFLFPIAVFRILLLFLFLQLIYCLYLLFQLLIYCLFLLFQFFLYCS